MSDQSVCALGAHPRCSLQDNFFVRGIRSIKHAMFTETEEGQTLALIKKLDPTWDLHEMLTSTLRPLPFDSVSCEANTSSKRAKPDPNCVHLAHHRALNGWGSFRVCCSARGGGSTEMGRVVPAR